MHGNTFWMNVILSPWAWLAAITLLIGACWLIYKLTRRARRPAADLWYLQDTRQYVGNDVLWWAKDGKGYTTDVSKAHVYSFDAAFRQAAVRDTDRPWPKSYIDGKTRPAVDFQHIRHTDAIAAATGGTKA